MKVHIKAQLEKCQFLGKITCLLNHNQVEQQVSQGKILKALEIAETIFNRLIKCSVPWGVIVPEAIFTFGLSGANELLLHPHFLCSHLYTCNNWAIGGYSSSKAFPAFSSSKRQEDLTLAIAGRSNDAFQLALWEGHYEKEFNGQFHGISLRRKP